MAFEILCVYFLKVKILLVNLFPKKRVYKNKQEQQEDNVDELLEGPLYNLNNYLKIAQGSEQLNRFQCFECPDYSYGLEHWHNIRFILSWLFDIFSIDIRHRLGRILEIVVHF